MAQIPMDGFSQARAVPRPEGNRVQLSNDAGRGAAAVGDALMRVSGQIGAEAAQRRAQESQDARALAKVRAANAIGEYELKIRGANADQADLLRRGADFEGASERYETAVSTIEPASIEGLDAADMEHYQGAITRVRMGGRLALDGEIVGARRDAGQREVEKFVEIERQKLGQGTSPATSVATVRAALDAARGQFGLDGSTLDKLANSYEDYAYNNDVANRVNAANGDLPGLEAVLRDLTADDGAYSGKLDGADRASKIAHVQNEIDRLQGKAERHALKADALSARLRGEFEDQVASGVPPTIEQSSAWAAAFKAAGPEEQTEWQRLYQDEGEVREILKRPIAQQLEAVRDREATMLESGGDARDRKNLARIKSGVEANIKLATDTPLRWAATRGGEEIEPLNLRSLLDPAQIGTVGAQLKSRATTIDTMRATLGPQVKTRLLFPEEAAGLVSVIDQATPDERLKLFGLLHTTMGSSRNYAAVMAQIAPDTPVLAVAGALAPQFPKSAKLLIDGEAILNRSRGDKEQDGKFRAIKMPTRAEFDAQFADRVGNAFRGSRSNSYSVAAQAVMAGYAGAAAADGDVSGELDGKRMEDVIDAVLGRTIDYNGRGSVFMPLGMRDEDEFEDKAEAAWRGIVGQVPAAFSKELGDYGLEEIGSGRYYLTSGRSYLPGADGKPVVLDLSRGVPRAPIKGATTATGAFGAF